MSVFVLLLIFTPLFWRQQSCETFSSYTGFYMLMALQYNSTIFIYNTIRLKRLSKAGFSGLQDGDRYVSADAVTCAQTSQSVHFFSRWTPKQRQSCAAHGDLVSLVLQSRFWGPVAPVRGPLLSVDTSGLLKLWPVPPRNLHCVVLRQLVLVGSPSEEATLLAREESGSRSRGWWREEAEDRGTELGTAMFKWLRWEHIHRSWYSSISCTSCFYCTNQSFIVHLTDMKTLSTWWLTESDFIS